MLVFKYLPAGIRNLINELRCISAVVHNTEQVCDFCKGRQICQRPLVATADLLLGHIMSAGCGPGSNAGDIDLWVAGEHEQRGNLVPGDLCLLQQVQIAGVESTVSKEKSVRFQRDRRRTFSTI